MPDTARIEQFEKMAQDDPNNELAHFSLGRAYLESNQPEPAAKSFQRALALNSNLSKAYQLLAEAQLTLNRREDAINSLTTGVTIANNRGDIMPKNAMLDKLKELGAPLPTIATPTGPNVAVGEGQVLCKRCGQVRPKLEKPPFRNPFGQEIFDQICQPCWREAIGQGTKVINELRLPLADPQAQKIWDQHIREFLNL